MVRLAWVMRLKPGNEAIYKQKHDEIWPEMLAAMQARRCAHLLDLPARARPLRLHGARQRRPIRTPDPSLIVWRWWEMMAPYMETNPDFSPVQ